MSADQAQGMCSIDAQGEITTLARDIGRPDGLYQMDDGTLLITDWSSGSLLHWAGLRAWRAEEFTVADNPEKVMAGFPSLRLWGSLWAAAKFEPAPAGPDGRP